MQSLVVKQVEKGDLHKLLELYTYLNENPFPDIDERIAKIWSRILADENHYIMAGYIDGALVSTCAIVIIENLTRQQTPYAVVENVVTHPNYRNRGYGLQVLSAAKAVAVKNGCHKIFLVTGAKDDGTLDFYRQAGFNSNDKTAFIQWLNDT